jgi:hypothetical protein
MPRSSRNLLDGFKIFFSQQQKLTPSERLRSYAGKIVQKKRELKKLKKALRKKDISYFTQGNFNIALAYIPFNKEFDDYEKNITFRTKG